MEKSFAQAEMAKNVHNLRKEHYMNKMMRMKLKLIHAALKATHISKATPIAHLIPGRDDGDCFGDVSLIAAGGWSIPMMFLWWIAWDDDIIKRTLRFIKNGKSGKLIDINALEYATIIINYAACIYFWVIKNNCSIKNISHPPGKIMSDNISSEVWAKKGCKKVHGWP